MGGGELGRGGGHRHGGVVLGGAGVLLLNAGMLLQKLCAPDFSHLNHTVLRTLLAKIIGTMVTEGTLLCKTMKTTSPSGIACWAFHK